MQFDDVTIVDDFVRTTNTLGFCNVNGSATGNLSFNGDHDWFAVTLAAGKTYVISLNGFGGGGGTLVDSYMQLYNSTGTLITGDDNSGPLFDSQLTFNVATTGTYYVDAGAFGNSYTGTYAVGVTRVVGLQDFGFDGKSDLLFRNTSTGLFTEWTSAGNNFNPNVYVDGTVSTAFTAPRVISTAMARQIFCGAIPAAAYSRNGSQLAAASHRMSTLTARWDWLRAYGHRRF